MENIVQKYNSLDSTSQMLINKFIDFLMKENKIGKNQINNYKKRLSEVSVWSEKDLKIFDELKEKFNKWNFREW